MLIRKYFYLILLGYFVFGALGYFQVLVVPEEYELFLHLGFFLFLLDHLFYGKSEKLTSFCLVIMLLLLSFSLGIDMAEDISELFLFSIIPVVLLYFKFFKKGVFSEDKQGSDS